MFDRLKDLLKLIDDIKTLVPLDTLVRLYRAILPLPAAWTDTAAVEAWLVRIAPPEAEAIAWAVSAAQGKVSGPAVASAGPVDFEWLACESEEEVRTVVAAEMGTATVAAPGGEPVGAIPLWVAILVEIAVEIWRRTRA